MHIYKSDSLNGFPLYFELTLAIKKCLLDDFIRSFPWYNVPKECNVKRYNSQYKIFLDDFGF